ncbi:MAG: hypothetical protein L0229_00320 [Blastocatellia bacterium]|nr:hypothetical protein [Blastocatellia bacterium]
MRIAVKIALIMLLLATAFAVRAQSPVTAITLSPDQIGQVKAAQGISTRISFPEKVKEVICGDLYDAASGKGSFVIQYSDNDVFLKPIVSKGMSNMFVKTGDGDLVYNFDLEIVPTAQAHRVVNVTLGVRARTVTPTHGEENGTNVNVAELEQRAREEADEIVRNARQQADRIIKQAETKSADADREAEQQRQQDVERRFTQGLMLGIRESKVKTLRAEANRVVIALDSKALTFEEKAYLRYTIQNGSTEAFTFGSISLEAVAAEGGRPIPVEILQSKAENRLEPGESLTGVVAFNPKPLMSKEKITLFVRGPEDAEIMRVSIQ